MDVQVLYYIAWKACTFPDIPKTDTLYIFCICFLLRNYYNTKNTQKQIPLTFLPGYM